MTRQDVMAGLEWINKRFYSPSRILRRLARWLLMPAGLSRFHIPLLLNVAYWGRQFQFNMKGYNPTRRAQSDSSPGGSERPASVLPAGYTASLPSRRASGP